MKILAVDTSTRMGSIALVEGPNLVAELQLNVEMTHTERLLPAIESLLKKTAWTLADLNGLALTMGPGSFTGLRIGLVTLKGFAQVHDLPLVGISSLLALGYNGVLSPWPVAAVMDAKREEIFGAVYQFEKGHLAKTILAEQCTAPGKFCEQLKTLEGCWFLGDGAVRYENFFRKKLGEKVFFPPLPLMRLQAKWVAWLALPKLEKGEGLDWKNRTPNYLRLSDAEIKKNG